ncbi:hypothetical protein BJV82DRAFT_618971 [Fennellomyces sp. T-0311]|nr:hypothetical protein BJV82DRAFT_618971 [Fennellomyces sp. T-0311]
MIRMQVAVIVVVEMRMTADASRRCTHIDPQLCNYVYMSDCFLLVSRYKQVGFTCLVLCVCFCSLFVCSWRCVTEKKTFWAQDRCGASHFLSFHGRLLFAIFHFMWFGMFHDAICKHVLEQKCQSH